MEGDDIDERRTLVFALAHEIGNLVAAVRLEAHLLADEEDSLLVARSALTIEDLSARVGALLSLVRPLLEEPGTVDPGAIEVAALVQNARQVLEEHTRSGVRITVELEDGLSQVVGDPERMNALLQLLVLGAHESVLANGGGEVAIRARSADDKVEIEIDDDAGEDREVAGWRDGVLRSRVLVCRVAESVVASLGGAVDVSCANRCTRIRLRLAAASDGPAAAL